MAGEQRVDLYWLPLGAGGHSVKWNGRAYEAIAARVEGRPARRLFHAALEVAVDGVSYVIEQAPEPDLRGERRGVVAEGPVGARWAGRFRLFRYEVRLWEGGSIPDVAEAVGGPVRLASPPDLARRVLKAVPRVPTPVWGRDELGAGEMWNSNAVISWTLRMAGADVAAIEPPDGGRAPGWRAGVVVAEREARSGIR